MADDPVKAVRLSPDKGLVTWGAEGQEGGPYHSRKFTVPSESSGLTIGRGYDMKERTTGEIANDLMKAGVGKEDAEKIAKAAGLKGDTARKFIAANKLEAFEISMDGQVTLFDAVYDALSKDTKRLCDKSDVVKKSGSVDWDKLDPTIRDILVDMRYRGDFEATARQKLQKLVVANDLEGFAAAVSKKENFLNVPADRFKRRKELLDAAVAEKAKKDKLAAPQIKLP